MCFIGLMIREVMRYFRRGWRVEDVLRDLKPGDLARNHLVQVHSTLVQVFLIAAFASFLTHRGTFDSSYAYFEVITNIVLFYLVIDIQIENMRSHAAINQIEWLKIFLLTFTAFSGGTSVFHWFTTCQGVDERFVVTSLLAYALYFGFHWASCKWDSGPSMQRWCWAGHLSGCIAAIIVYFAAAVLWGFELQLFRWLILPNVVLLVYVLAYSYEIALKVNNGDEDYLNHAMEFFIYFPAITLNVLITSMTSVAKWLGAGARMTARKQE